MSPFSTPRFDYYSNLPVLCMDDVNQDTQGWRMRAMCLKQGGPAGEGCLVLGLGFRERAWAM